MSRGLTEYRHALGFTVPLPAGWERVDDPGPGVAVVAVEPETGLGFRANVVVTVDDLPAGLDLHSWQAATEEVLPRALQDYLLLDLEHTQSAGRPVVRRLAHHLVEGSGAVTMEQWASAADGRGFTITASVATLAYDSLADLFAEIAAGWRAADDSGERR